MKRILFNIVITIIAIFVMIANITSVFAVEETGITKMESNKTTVEKDETFTVTVSQESEDGIVAFESSLEYDDELFTLTNKSVGSGWGDLSDGNKLDVFSSSGDPITNGKICVLTFSVNDDAVTTQSTISLKDIVYYVDDENNETQNNISINVSVGESSSTSNEVTNSVVLNNTTENNEVVNNTVSNTTTNNTTENNTTTNNTTGNNTTTNNTTENNTTTNNTTGNNTTTNNTTGNNTTGNNATTNNTTNTSVSNTSIPKTGSTANKVLITTLFTIGCSLVFYVQYRKYNEI